MSGTIGVAWTGSPSSMIARLSGKVIGGRLTSSSNRQTLLPRPAAERGSKSSLASPAARTRVLREVFERLCERLCERLDPDGAYTDTLASKSLQADRLDSAAPTPFWWWHLDFGREESLFHLVGADLEQLKVARSDRAALISFLNGLTTVSGLVGATLFDIQDVEEALRTTVGAQEQPFEHSITATVGHLRRASPSCHAGSSLCSSSTMPNAPMRKRRRSS